MTVVSVAFDGTRLDDAETPTTGVWFDTGGGKAIQEPDLVYQNTYSVSEKVGLTEFGIGYYDSTGVDMSTTPRVALIKATISNLGVLYDEGPTGAQVMIGSGSYSTDFYEYYVVGGNTWEPSLRWLFCFIDPNVTAYRDNTVGITPTLTAIDWFGIKATFSAASKAENVAMDAIEWCNSGKGMTLTAGTGADPPGVFQDFVDYDEGTINNRWGVVYSLSGTIYCNLTLTIGSATATEFDSSNEQVVFPNLWLDSGAQGVSIDLQSASTVVSMENDFFSSVGRDNRKHFFDTEYLVDGTNDELDITAHEYLDGEAVLYSKEGSAEAIGLTDATEYWVEVVTVDSISLHTSRQNAMTAAAPVDLTASSAGNGANHSIRRQPYTTPHFTVTSTNGTLALAGCNFVRFGDVVFTSKPTFTGCSWVEPKAITPGGATFTNCTFTGATTVEGESLMSGVVASLEAFTDSTLVAGDWGGHAYKVTGAVSALDITNLTWTGYGNDPGDGNGMAFDTENDVDGTNDEIDYTAHGWTNGDPVYYSKNDPTDGTLGTEAIGLTDDALYYVRAVTVDAVSLHPTRYAAVNNQNKIDLTASGVGDGETHTLYSGDAAIINNTGGAMTVNVTDGNKPSVRNIDGAITTVIASVTIEITGLSESSRGIIIGSGGAKDGVILLENYANSSGVISGGFGGTTPQNVVIYCRNSGIISSAIQHDEGGSDTDYTSEARDDDVANDVLLLPATPAINDAFYFGGLDQFEEILAYISTVGSTYVLIWEYYNGSGWSTLTVTDSSNSFQSTGWHRISFSAPSNWDTTTFATLGPHYFVRARVTTGGGTQPKAEQITLNKTTKYKPYDNTDSISATGLSHKAVWLIDPYPDA